MILLLVLLTITPKLQINYNDTLFQGDVDTASITATDSSNYPLDSVKIKILPLDTDIIAISDTDLYTDTSGSAQTVFRALNPGYTDIYLFGIYEGDTAFDSIRIWVIDTTIYFYISVYPAKMSINSDEVDSVYARLYSYSPDSLVAGRHIYFNVVKGSGGISPSMSNTDINGIAQAVFHPYIGDTVFVEGYFKDDKGRIIADTTRIIVNPSEVDTLRVFGDSLFFYPSPIGHGYDRANIEYLLPSSFTDLEIRIMDPFGNTVFLKRITPGENGGVPGKWNRIQWDGTNNNGKKVASGMYILVLRVFKGPYVLKKLYKRVGVEW